MDDFPGLPKSNLNRIKRQFIQAGQITGQSCWEKESRKPNYLKIDFICDGYDLDTLRFPKKEKDLRIFDIDEYVTEQAAKGIRQDAADLSWVYLWYTDDAGHIEGNGRFFDDYTQKADAQIGKIWDAVKYREANFNEDWMIVVTTDHGRGENGHGLAASRNANGLPGYRLTNLSMSDLTQRAWPSST